MKPDTDTSPLLTTANTPQQRAAKSYKSNSYQGLSQREMMAQIYQKIINHLYLARDAYVAKNMEMMVEQDSKAIHILDILREELLGSGALKDPEAAPAAQFLVRTYGELVVRIANVLQSKPAVDEFNAIIEVLKPIYQAWLPPAPEQPPAEPKTNTAG